MLGTQFHTQRCPHRSQERSSKTEVHPPGVGLGEEMSLRGPLQLQPETITEDRSGKGPGRQSLCVALRALCHDKAEDRGSQSVTLSSINPLQNEAWVEGDVVPGILLWTRVPRGEGVCAGVGTGASALAQRRLPGG